MEIIAFRLLSDTVLLGTRFAFPNDLGDQGHILRSLFVFLIV